MTNFNDFIELLLRYILTEKNENLGFDICNYISYTHPYSYIDIDLTVNTQII